MRPQPKRCAIVAVLAITLALASMLLAEQYSFGVARPGPQHMLVPAYPDDLSCSKLTSLFGSWTDIDGSRRKKAHTGVDGGQLGEWILAPADGTIKAVWRANWGWGPEGALLIRHTRSDVNLKRGPPFYYSEFDHMDYSEIKRFKVGDRIKRGQRLARVNRPGGKRRFLPEVHWEVWEVWRDRLRWTPNRYGAPSWINARVRLINPLSMLGPSLKASHSSLVHIRPHTACTPKAPCRGFTYILPCTKK